MVFNALPGRLRFLLLEPGAESGSAGRGGVGHASGSVAESKGLLRRARSTIYVFIMNTSVIMNTIPKSSHDEEDSHDEDAGIICRCRQDRRSGSPQRVDGGSSVGAIKSGCPSGK